MPKTRMNTRLRQEATPIKFEPKTVKKQEVFPKRPASDLPIHLQDKDRAMPWHSIALRLNFKKK